MSTFYHTNGKQSIKRTPDEFTIMARDPETEEVLAIDPYEAISLGIRHLCAVSECRNYVWLDVDADGTIMGYTRYGRNDASVFGSWIPGISEYVWSELCDSFWPEDVDVDDLNEDEHRSMYDDVYHLACVAVSVSFFDYCDNY